MSERTVLILLLLAGAPIVPIAPAVGWVMLGVALAVAGFVYYAHRAHKQEKRRSRVVTPNRRRRRVGNVTLTVDEHGNVLEVS